jgi:tRNA dimethylallyltransferase
MPNITSSTNKFLIILAGPTAIGKTNLAMDMAERYQTDIFSADSRQIYKEMHIGTAKPERAILEKVKHHFIDHISIGQNYSVGHYYKEITEALAKYFEKNDIAVVTGGTGLYLRAIMEGLDEFPEIPDQIIGKYNLAFQTGGIVALQNELKSKDPEYFEKVDIHNPRRLMRALSVIEVTKNTFSSFLNQTQMNKTDYVQIPVLLELPRECLYERINKRVDLMVAEGLIAEVQGLYPHREKQALETVGYQELFDHFDGNLTLTQALDLIKQNTRRYAKRQMTWFRKYGNWATFKPDDRELIFEYIEKHFPENLKNPVI